MTDLTQAIADGLFNVLLIFEEVLFKMDGIAFLDTAFSILDLFYGLSLIFFIIETIVYFINPDIKESEEIELSNDIDIDDNFSIGMTDD
jgi:hypothetical protein